MKCIAIDKLFLFHENKLTFRVGMSAFSQAHPKLLEGFLLASKENQELITYFLYISNPAVAKEIIENFSALSLAALFRSDFLSFKNIQDSRGRGKGEKNFFKIKSYRYWTYINYRKICDILVHFVRESKEPEFAAQFLVMLPSAIVSNLKDYTGFSPEEEKFLYQALGDSIYELPIQSPKIYDHMLSLFADDMEIFFVLSTMENLIRRQEQILDLSEKLLSYVDSKRIELNIQFIFSELSGIDLGTAVEILNQLLEKKAISPSQKTLIMNFLENGNLDILKSLKNDLIK